MGFGGKPWFLAHSFSCLRVSNDFVHLHLPSRGSIVLPPERHNADYIFVVWRDEDRQHNLSMGSFVISLSGRMIVDYISSPEVTFLRGISKRFKFTPAKLIFQLLGPDDVEPSTNQTYRSLTTIMCLSTSQWAISVDGVLSDYPITPSATIDCFSHTGKMSHCKEQVGTILVVLIRHITKLYQMVWIYLIVLFK